MTEQKRRTRQSQQSESTFKKPISIYCKNCVLLEWDFYPYTYKDDNEKEVVSDKVIAAFSIDGGNGDIIAVEIYDKVMDAWDAAKPVEGERFDISINLKSRKITQKDDPKSSFFSNRVKCWKFEKCK